MCLVYLPPWPSVLCWSQISMRCEAVGTVDREDILEGLEVERRQTQKATRKAVRKATVDGVTLATGINGE